VLAAYIRAQLLACALIGSVCGVAFAILGVHYAVLLGVLAAVLEFIPLVGPFLAAAIVTVVAAFQAPILALRVAGFLAILRVLHDYVVYPRLVGRGLHLHPFVVVIAVLAGSSWAVWWDSSWQSRWPPSSRSCTVTGWRSPTGHGLLTTPCNSIRTRVPDSTDIPRLACDDSTGDSPNALHVPIACFPLGRHVCTVRRVGVRSAVGLVVGPPARGCPGHPPSRSQESSPGGRHVTQTSIDCCGCTGVFTVGPRRNRRSSMGERRWSTSGPTVAGLSMCCRVHLPIAYPS
jgi:hypothetical protein